MKGVLVFLGGYLYIVWRVAELPVLSFLYLLFAFVVMVRGVYKISRLVPAVTKRSFHYMHDLTKPVFDYGHKLQSRLLHR